MKITNMSGMGSSNVEEVLEPVFAFLGTDRPFAEVSRLAVVSRNWRAAALKSLKTAPQLNLSGFAESVRDEDVRLALVRVTSEHLKRVDLSGCHHISAGGMEDILHYISATCCGVKEVDLTACSNETVLRAVATRARAALGAPLALDLFVLLRSLGEEGMRYSLSNLRSRLQSPPLLLFDRALAPRENALLQAAEHGTAPEVAMLLSLSFAVGDEEGNVRTYDVNEKDSQGNSPLLLACRSGNFDIAEILVVAGAGVNARNGDGASALHLVVASYRARSLEMFETLLKAGADVNVVRPDGASVLALAIVSGNAPILNCRMMPTMIEYAASAEISFVRRLSLAFLEPNNIFRWLKDGRSARELLGVLCALMASAATERPMQDRLSHVRAFINCHSDLLQDPTPLAPLTVTDVVKQLVLQESDSVFDNTDPQWNASIERGVVWVKKPPAQHACRWTIQAGGHVQSLAYSSDGSRLARAEGDDVVICDAVSGFEVHRLKGHG
jgi:ankyrin repeat protein